MPCAERIISVHGIFFVPAHSGWNIQKYGIKMYKTGNFDKFVERIMEKRSKRSYKKAQY